MSSASRRGDGRSPIQTRRTKSHSLPVTFKRLEDISSTLSSLRRKRRAEGESNDFALTGPEILWLKWPRGSRQIWQSVSFWVELLVNHSFLLNCRNAFSLNWAICSWCSLSPAAGAHVGRWFHAVRLLFQFGRAYPPPPNTHTRLLLIFFSSHLRPHCWDCFTWKDKKTTETWSHSVEIRTR